MASPDTNSSDTSPAGTCAGRLIVIQRNPISGSGTGRHELRVLINELKRRGFRLRLFASRIRLDRWLSMDVRRQEVSCLVAAGGDGTVADLTNRYPGIPIAILPLGTENLVARYLKIPRDGRSVAEMITAGRIRTMDSFLVEGRRVLLMLSVGADADVVRRIAEHRSGNIRHLNYLRPILKSLLLYRPQQIRAVSADGQNHAVGSHVIVTNIPAYGFGFPFAPDALPDDGLLDVRVFTGQTRLKTAIHALLVRFHIKTAEESVVRFRCRDVKLMRDLSSLDAESTHSAYGGLQPPVQCDGDPGPALPLTISAEKASLRLVIP
jgi:diacylglycerol kinase (ATP)